MSMSDLDLQALFLTAIVNYGSPMVAVALFLGALGIPVPGSLLVIASGAFIRQGILPLSTTPLLALLGAVIGDITIYGLGRFANHWIEQRVGQLSGWQKAKAFFDQQGGRAIYLTRWLFTPIGMPTALVAGTSHYPFTRFLLFDVSGEITWIVLFGGLGYAFGSQWELISEVITNFSGVLVGLLAVGVGVYLLLGKRESTAEVSA